MSNMIVDVGESFGYSSEYLKLAPCNLCLVYKVKLSEDHVDIVEKRGGNVLEAIVFAPFTVDFQDDALALQLMCLYDILQSIKSSFFSFLCFFAKANVIETASRIIIHQVNCVLLAYRRMGIGAVVLIVEERIPFCELASHIIESIDTDVYNGIRGIKEIAADHISSVFILFVKSPEHF